ncbi:MAG: protein kinase [Actinobacteria bacterium]|nr:protein kinase [Actinomycetota bacterium]
MPDSLAGYPLLSMLHQTENYTVWRAYDSRNHRDVVIKTITPSVRKLKRALQGLEREARMGLKLYHKNLVRFESFAIDGVKSYLVMEFVAGKPISNWLNENPARKADLKRLLMEAADALAYIHEQGFVHRDVKPGNILVNESGELKIIDFSISIKAGFDFRRLVRSKPKISGTRDYMAPEQVLGRRSDAQADIYGLGATMYELLAGRPPFHMDNSKKSMQQHLTETPRPVRSLNSNITPEAGEMVMAMLAKHPQNRPAGMRQVGKRLQEIELFSDLAP